MIVELWWSLSAVAAGLLHRRNNGYEATITKVGSAIFAKPARSAYLISIRDSEF
jgi:hypothetical protein